MPNRTRIHITGASGAGTTTLGGLIASRMGLLHLDTDSYFWLPTDPPFEQKRPLEERQVTLLEDLSAGDRWVLSGSLCGWGDFAIPLFDLVIYLWIPPEIRMERLRLREQRRHGERILPGGDMESGHQEFMAWAERYDQAGMEQRSRVLHDDWLSRIPCPVLRIEGDMTNEERFQIVQKLLSDRESC
jgi:adenylate kinase family enzyme